MYFTACRAEENISNLSFLIFLYLFIFQLTFEDEEIAHLLDPVTGEINKDNFVAYSLERKLLDAQVRFLCHGKIYEMENFGELCRVN